MPGTKTKVIDHPPTILVDKSYTEINRMAEETGWDLDFRQLEPGALHSEAMLVGHADLMLLRVRFDRSFHQIGSLPPFDWTFGLPDIESGQLMWKGERTRAGVLINFSYEGRLDVTNPPGAFQGYVFSLSERFMARGFAELGIAENLLACLKERRFWSPDLKEVAELRALTELLFTVAASEGDRGLASWQHVFNLGFPAQLARATANPQSEPGHVTSKFQAAALNRALGVINSYDEMPATVSALCEMSGASWSTLERAFKEEFGLGPKGYLKVRRLTAVRNEIARGGNDTLIREIANQWGFWHMGSFAADYRKQFGELPSETRKKAG